MTFTPLLLAPVIPPGLVTFLPFVLIIAVFYLMLVRPNQKKQKQWQEMLGALKSGRPHHHHRRHARNHHFD